MNEKYRTLSEAEGGDVETRSGGITANSPDISFEPLVLLLRLPEPPAKANVTARAMVMVTSDNFMFVLYSFGIEWIKISAAICVAGARRVDWVEAKSPFNEFSSALNTPYRLLADLTFSPPFGP